MGKLYSTDQFHIAKITFLATSLLYVAALLFPAFYTLGEKEYPSLGVLLLGWMGALQVIEGDLTYIPWLANPFLFLSLIFTLVGTRRLAFFSSMTALVLGGLTPFVTKAVLLNAAGTIVEVVENGAGFYLWLSALGVNVVGTSFLFLLSRNSLTDASPKPC